MADLGQAADGNVQFFKGKKASLPEENTNGSIYLTTDDKKLHVDVSDSERVTINAESADNLIVDGEPVTADQFVQKKDVIDVQHGGTGQSVLTSNALVVGNGIDKVKSLTVNNGEFVIGDTAQGVVSANAETAREKMDVYDTATVDSKVAAATANVYTATLSGSGWSQGSGDYVQTYNQPALRCGPKGDLPPIITYSTNQEDWSKITSAEATKGQGITFHTADSSLADIQIIIIDH